MRLATRLLTAGCAVALLALPATLVLTAGAATASPHALAAPAQVSASDWSVAPGPTPAPSGNYADSVSCVASTFCMGVGFLDPLYYAQEWTGAQWVQVAMPPVSGTEPEMSGVSCVSATWCVAVGTDRLTNFSPLIEQWNGTGWSVVQDANTSNEQVLQQVSCSGVWSCLAVGTDETAHQAIAEQWNGATWSSVNPPSPPGADDSVLDGVSCVVSSCMAVGTQVTGTTDSPWAESWNGTTWTTVPTAPGVTGGFHAVSCAGAGFCAAAGFQGTFNTTGLVELWNGASFTSVTLPDAETTNGDVLSGVSCISPTSCTAVGTSETGPTTNVSLAMTWDGRMWSSASVPAGSGSVSTGLLGVSCVTNWACLAVGPSFDSGSDTLSPFNVMAPISRSGYRFAASDGGVFAYGAGAPFLGSMGGTHLNAPIVGMATMPAGDGYYLVASDGGVFNFGSAQFFGSMGGMHLNKPIVGIAVTADGGGYWLVASDGGIFAFGDAQFFGSTGNLTLDKPVVGMAATTNGLGYYLVASDGGIFAYGNAVFSGSMGGQPLNKPIVGMAVPVAGGYYLVASDGGIFSFPTGSGGPPFFGSTGALTLNKPIVGMTTAAGGYYLSGSDGGIFSFPSVSSGPPFLGSTGSITLNAPIVAVSG